MSILDSSRIVESSSGKRAMMDDESLLQYARDHGLRPWQAQRLALEEGILPDRYEKNLTAITLEQQLQISSARVVVCGCGGLGGTILMLLARLGVGHIRMADGDRFAPSNLNRQWLCDTTRMDQPKAAVGREWLERINPFVEVDPRDVLITEENAAALLEGADLVLDAFDNIPGRLVAARAAAERRLPFIHGAVAGWWGQMVTLMPDSRIDLGAIYGTRRARDPAEKALGVLGSAAAVIGSLQAMEATRLLSGRTPAYAERMLYFDGEAGTMELIALAP